MTIDIGTETAFPALKHAPGPAKTSWLDRLSARWAGFRDAGRVVPTDGGHFAYTRQQLAATRLIEARIGGELHRQVEIVDVRIAEHSAAARALRERVATQHPAGGETRPDGIVTPAVLRAARTRAVRHAAARDAEQRLQTHLQKVEMLVVARNTLHDVARTLTGTYAARYETLCAVHRRAWQSRTARRRRKDGLGHVDGVGETLRLPVYESAQPWMAADLPAPAGIAPRPALDPADDDVPAASA